MAGEDQPGPSSPSVQEGSNHTGSTAAEPTIHNDSPATATRSTDPKSAAEPPSGTATVTNTKEGKDDSVPPADTPAEPPTREYMRGWRLHVLLFALCLSLLLSTLESTIVSTSLVSISNSLGGFNQRDWVVTSYLITYTGFLVIYAKFSDVLGRKWLLLLALAFFTVFSVVCGVVSDMVQLTVFRAFQGIGGSGIYAMVTVIQPEMVPPEKWGNYLAATSVVMVLSSVLGPILGGVINDHTTWRWVFLLNAPAGVVATGLIAFAMPNNFPDVRRQGHWTGLRAKLSRASLARLDVVGAALLLVSTVLLVFAFEEGGSRYGWASAGILSSLVIGAAVFVAFVGWEKFVGRGGSAPEPVFPLRLMRSRIFAALIMAAFCTGPPFMTVLINLPQRFQAVDGDSPFGAGIRMLPLLLASPVAIVVSGQLASRFKVPPFYLLLFASSLQMVGVGLTSSVPFVSGNQMYGYEVLMGFGFGMGLVSLLIFMPMVVTRADLGVAMGSVTQIRVLGGTIGLAISATVLNNHVNPRLGQLLSGEQLRQISESVQYISALPDGTRDTVRRVFADGYNAQMRVVLYINAGVFLGALALWERRPRSTANMKGF